MEVWVHELLVFLAVGAVAAGVGAEAVVFGGVVVVLAVLAGEVLSVGE